MRERPFLPWERSLGENGDMCMYGWLPWLFTWNYHNSVNWLCAKSLQSCPTLCDPMDGSPPGSSPMGFSRVLYHYSHLGSPPNSLWVLCVLSCFSHVWLCNLMDGSWPGSSVHGILQARIQEGVVMLSSRGSSLPRDQIWVSWVSCIGR